MRFMTALYALFRIAPQCYILHMTTAEDIEKADYHP
jgi:hypothetical protein